MIWITRELSGLLALLLLPGLALVLAILGVWIWLFEDHG